MSERQFVTQPAKAQPALRMESTGARHHANVPSYSGSLPTSAVLSESASAPLSRRLATDFSGRFHQDFSGIRIHTDGRAAEFASALKATAFTVGNHVWFGSGAYAPHTPKGRALLAHELAHVAQQRHAEMPAAVRMARPGEAVERQAEQSAERIMRGGAVRVDPVPWAFLGRQTVPGTGVSTRRVQAIETRQTADERRLSVLEKRQASSELDLRWRARFGERIASYRQSILRISGALNTAEQGFQAAQVAQAQTDALQTQLIGAALAVGFAAGFEWIFTLGLGRLGVSANRIKQVVETVENPANALASGAVNVAGVLTAGASTREGTTPSLGGGAFAFLTRNSEGLERHAQEIEQAFLTRSQRLQNFNDAQWLQFSPQTQEATYQGLLDAMTRDSLGVEELKVASALSQVLERHLWALWIRGQREQELQSPHHLASVLRAGQAGPQYAQQVQQNPAYDVGSDIEVRLNQVGVSGAAGVTLTGHFYSSNSPSNWRAQLAIWAANYRESIRI